MDDRETAGLKATLRQQFLTGTAGSLMSFFLDTKAGKIAERLRRLSVYRNARCVLVPPTQFYRQTALNVLLDGKRLVYSSPKMQKGFFLVDPGKIPPAQKAAAAAFRSPNPWARRIAHRSHEKVHVDLVVIPCVAAARDGGRLGDGSGLVDLQLACLQTLGWLHPGTTLIGVVPETHVVDSIPMKSTDVRVHWIVTEHAAFRTTWQEEPRALIIWTMLDAQTTRRNDVLFFLKGEA